MFSLILAFVGFRYLGGFFGALLGFSVGGFIDRKILVFTQASAKAK